MRKSVSLILRTRRFGNVAEPKWPETNVEEVADRLPKMEDSWACSAPEMERMCMEDQSGTNFWIQERGAKSARPKSLGE